VPDLRAPAGQGGMWLLDPEDIEISTAATANVSGPYNFSPSGSDVISVVNNAAIESALNGGTSVTINTSGGNASADKGNVYFNAPVQKTSGGSAVTLAILANKSIYANSSIGSNVGSLNVTMTADQDSNGSGDVFINNGIVTANGMFTAS